jgi:hypothetical protein
VTLVAALVVASICLIPGQPPALFAAEMLAIGAGTLAVPLLIQLPSLRSLKSVSALRKLARAILTTVSSILFVIAGIELMTGSGTGLYWIATGIIVSLVAGVWNAWVLLVEILR